MERPAALDLFRIEDAARLISMMPDMVVTVTDTAGDFWWQPGSRLKEGEADRGGRLFPVRWRKSAE